MRENFGKNFCFFNFIRIFAPAWMSTIEPWCNGNTADFGSVILGSNPGSSTQKTPEDALATESVFFLFWTTTYLIWRNADPKDTLTPN